MSLSDKPLNFEYKIPKAKKEKTQRRLVILYYKQLYHTLQPKAVTHPTLQAQPPKKNETIHNK